MDDHVDAFTDVLGAYAVDAVDQEERDEIELHLAECPRCRAEVAEHREVAALLSQTGGLAPAGVWDRILAELSPPAPPLHLSFTPAGEGEPVSRLTVGEDGALEDGGLGSPRAVPLTRRRASRGVRTRTFAALLSAAAVIVAVLGVVNVGQSRRLDRMEATVRDVSLDRLANRAISGSGVQVHLTGTHGSAQAAVTDAGQGYLITKDLPPPADGDVYQLWGQVDGTVVSLGTFGGATSVVPFTVDPRRIHRIQSFAVTQEHAPGVVSSANQPVVAGTA